MTRTDDAAATTRDETDDVGYTSVLVPLDGSDLGERALGPARRLARAFGAPLRVISSAHRDERWWYERYLGQLAGRAEDVAPMLWDDRDPVRAVLSVARQLDPCLVCMATHGRSRNASVVGSTFAGVAAQRAAPLVAVGPRTFLAGGRAAAPDHLVVCLDGNAAAERALPLAAAWSRRLGWRLTAVTAADPVLVDRDLEGYLREVVRRPELDGLDVDARVLWGPEYPHTLISRYVTSEPTGLLVATTHARTGLARAALGSEVARIVHHSPVPVLVQPPTAS